MKRWTIMLVAVSLGGWPLPAISDQESRPERARQLLHQLIGDWCFELSIAAQPDRAPMTGRRQFTPHAFDNSLSWSENFDGRDTEISGVFGYSATSDTFFEFGLASTGEADYLVGTWTRDGDAVSFSAISARNVLQLISADQFEFVRLVSDTEGETEQWRAVFNRCP